RTRRAVQRRRDGLRPPAGRRARRRAALLAARGRGPDRTVGAGAGGPLAVRPPPVRRRDRAHAVAMKSEQTRTKRANMPTNGEISVTVDRNRARCEELSVGYR